jgi:hypothetical protein
MLTESFASELVLGPLGALVLHVILSPPTVLTEKTDKSAPITGTIHFGGLSRQ